MAETLTPPVRSLALLAFMPQASLHRHQAGAQRRSKLSAGRLGPEPQG